METFFFAILETYLFLDVDGKIIRILKKNVISNPR